MEANEADRTKEAIALHRGGIRFARKNRWDDAIAAFRDAIRINPTFVPAHVDLASTLTDANRLEDAEQVCRDLIRLAPALAAGHAQLGFVLAKLGRTEEEIGSYRDSIR